jgi:hypothetical protein
MEKRIDKLVKEKPDWPRCDLDSVVACRRPRRAHVHNGVFRVMARETRREYTSCRI